MNELNERQREAALHSEGPLLILAGAGAGKTRTIAYRVVNLIKEGIAPHHILAVTFTNKAAREMRERIRHLIAGDQALNLPVFIHEAPFVSTFHSLGAHILRENARILDLPKRFSIYDRSDQARAVKEATIGAGLDPKQFEPRKILGTISRQKGNAVSRQLYSESAENEYYPRIVASVWGEYENILAREKALDFDDLLLKTVSLLQHNAAVRKYYQDIWQYIHIDEYQDTNKVQYELSRLLAEKERNICVVGDLDQCLLKGTQITTADGSVKPIEEIFEGAMVLSNYGSGDWRPARVTDVFSRPFSGDIITITTNSGRVIASTPEHMHFAGYRYNLTPQMHFTYLMSKKNMGFRLGTSQMYTQGQKNSVTGFVQRCNQEHGDGVWIIGVHKKPEEARTHEYKLSLQYQIPTLPFVARKGLSRRGYVHDQHLIEEIFSFFDTEKTAAKLLQDHGLLQEYPHHRAQSRNSNRRNIILTLCGDRRGKTPMHRISIIGNDREGDEKLASIGLSVRPAKNGSRSWRFETVNKNYGDLLETVKRIKRIFPEAEVIKNARFGTNKKYLRGKNSLAFLPAASVLPGMALFTENGEYDLVQRVERAHNSRSFVFDLNIENTHNFVANGIVTHNSIYSWRGADITNILDFEKHYPEARIIRLEENYRSTKTIVDTSNEIIKKNKRRKEKNLFTNNAVGEKISLFAAFDEEDEAHFAAGKAKELIEKGISPERIAVLYRANFQSRVLEEAFLFEEVPYQVVGTRFFERKEVKDILSFIRAARNPESISDLKRIINIPPRGIGKVTFVKMIAGKEDMLAPSMKKRIDGFNAMLSDIRRIALTALPSETIRYVLARTGLEESLKDGTDEELERLENIRELVTLATGYDGMHPEEGMEKLLEDAALATEQDELKDEKSAVRLMTVHASKGLEFECVFITGLEEGLFPHERIDEGESRDNEEERRLFYVALTRAQKKVFLTYTHMRTIFGSRQGNIPSEFITDIDESVLEIEEGREKKQKIITIE